MWPLVATCFRIMCSDNVETFSLNMLLYKNLVFTVTLWFRVPLENHIELSLQLKISVVQLISTVVRELIALV